MCRKIEWGFSLLTLFLFAALSAGCGSGNKEGAQQQILPVSQVGDSSCLACHSTSKDLTMATDNRTIGSVWQDSLHQSAQNGIATVHCEDCHGSGQNHFGVGPIPFPDPMADRCLQCHSGATAASLGLNDKTSYLSTDHANGNNVPDSTFSQIPTPVSSGLHIQECSVCHNSNQKFVFDSSGNLTEPAPASLPTPQVACASCHDGHQVAKTDPNFANGDYQIFRKVQVNANGANDTNAGTWQRPRMYRDDLDNPATQSYPLDANGKRELNIETSCSSCHTVGVYKNSGTATHQTDVGSQWNNSAHGSRDEAAWAEFSANPPAYTNPDTGLPYAKGTHFTTYPYDMSNSAGKDFACKKCHNGISSIDYQRNVQGTSSARVVWGDEPATCITCHDAHPRTDLGSTVNDMNVRRPVIMTNYVTASATIVGNVFLDNSAVPAQALGATSVICIFCHQGRESGLTLYKTKLAPGLNPSGSFFNPHYLGTAAMIWGVNAYEYTGKLYGANLAHQGANCATCHMANPTGDNQNGGHTWSPNVATCNTAACHGGFGPVAAQAGTVSPDLSTYRATFDTNDYDGTGATTPIAVAIQNLQADLIALLAANGIFYDDLIYPYVFSDAAHTTSFTAWNRAPDGPAAYKACFNLQYIIKGLPSATTSQANVPNASGAVHNYRYIIQLLRDSYDDYNAAATTKGPALGGVRPSSANDRPARVYGPGQ